MEADEDDVKVVVSVPALGISKTDYINEIEEDESSSIIIDNGSGFIKAGFDCIKT